VLTTHPSGIVRSHRVDAALGITGVMHGLNISEGAGTTRETASAQDARASGARRLDAVQTGRELVLGTLEVVLSPYTHPKAGRGAEIASKPQCGISGDRGFLAGQALNARTRHPHCLCDIARASGSSAAHLLSNLYGSASSLSLMDAYPRD
jgi:hypothetical protein